VVPVLPLGAVDSSGAGSGVVGVVAVLVGFAPEGSGVGVTSGPQAKRTSAHEASVLQLTRADLVV
jgi:hypothetical protein